MIANTTESAKQRMMRKRGRVTLSNSRVRHSGETTQWRRKTAAVTLANFFCDGRHTGENIYKLSRRQPPNPPHHTPTRGRWGGRRGMVFLVPYENYTPHTGNFFLPPTCKKGQNLKKICFKNAKISWKPKNCPNMGSFYAKP